MGLLTDRISNKLETSNLINEHALNVNLPLNRKSCPEVDKMVTNKIVYVGLKLPK